MSDLGYVFSCSSSATQLAKDISCAVNCFGFDKKKQWQLVQEAGCQDAVADFACAWISFQAKEAADGLYDARNALSSQIAARLSDLCDLYALRSLLSSFRDTTNETVLALHSLHRTLKQTLTGFCFFVLEQYFAASPALNSALDALCGAPFHFFAETNRDRRTLFLDRAYWHVTPFI